MKNRFIHHAIFFPLAFFSMIIFSGSCSKNNSSDSENESVCVNRIYPKAGDNLVSSADLDSIFRLFNANNLSTANLQYVIWQVDTPINIYPNQNQNWYEKEWVAAVQFINGFPVFDIDESFIFNSGKLAPNGVSNGFTGPVPSTDTSTHQTYANLRTAFLAHVSESYSQGGSRDSKPFVPSASTYTNACLNVTLGYIDASQVHGSTAAPNSALVMVWFVTPSENSSITYYPIVIVVDDNGLAWGSPEVAI
jgi:hypothetical protein